MSIRALSFPQLGAAFSELFREITGETVSMFTYPGRLDPNDPSGYRISVNREGWSAAFFLWKQPRLKGVYHMLECRIRFDRVRNMVFPVYTVLHEVAKQDLRCCCFSQIISREELEESLRWMWKVLNSHREEIDRLAVDPAALTARQKQEFCEFYRQDIFSVLEDPDLSPELRRTGERKLKMCLADWYVRYNARVTGKTYQMFLDGDFQHALKKFHHGTALNEYEVALGAYMTTHETLDFQPMPDSLLPMMHDHPGETVSASVGDPVSVVGDGENSTEQVRTFAAPKQQTLPATFTLSNALISGLLQWPLWCLLFGALYALDFHWGAEGMKVILGYQLTDIVFCGWVAAFSTSFLGIPRVAEFRYRNHPQKEQLLKMASRYAQPRAVRTFHTFRWIAVAVCTIYIYIFAISGLAFTDSGFYDRNHGNINTGVYYSYGKVEKVEHIEGDGSVLSGSDWKICLKDGTELLVSEDYGIPENKFEEKALPLFEAAGVTVEE